MATQLAFNLRLRDGSSLDNFVGAHNREAVECLRNLLNASSRESGPASLLLWGEPATGKTHLLEAAFHSVQARGAAALYLPLANSEILPIALEEAQHAFLVCLDDVQCIAGNAAWESALFAFYELARSTGAVLIAAASAPPMHLGLTMPELATRLGWGPVYQLHALSDSDRLAAIQLRARNRGFTISVAVARYILHRYPRDLTTLFTLLDRIDAASLARQRRVTIPFLQQLEMSSSGN